MRIYGKTFPEIWQDIPLSYRIVVVAGTLFIITALVFLTYHSFKGVKSQINAGTGAIEILMSRGGELLDPSIAVDGSKNSALVYTSIEPASTQSGSAVRINLATSPYPCKRWNWNSAVFEERAEDLLAPDGVTVLAKGQTRYETPSIVHDAGDPTAPWKIFAYRYFWMGTPSLAQRYGMIVMRTAQSPFEKWSDEQWILSAAPDFPPPPYQGLVRAHINPMSPDLAGITGYARPSVIADRGVLLMSLVAFKNSVDVDRVILMISLDHGKRWQYAGTMLTRAQLAQMGDFTRISGASLIKQGQSFYLAAVLGDTAVAGLGTYLFRITDAGKGTLLTNDAGVPAAVRHIPRQSIQPTTMGGGYATYDESCSAGIITSEHSGTRSRYQLFSTQIHPSDAQ